MNLELSPYYVHATGLTEIQHTSIYFVYGAGLLQETP